MFGVYARGQNLRSAPFTFVEFDAACWLIDSGAAEWVNNRGKSLRLLYCPETVRGTAAQMGPRVTEAVWEGKKWALAIVEMWRAKNCGIPSAQSGRNGRIARDSRALARGVLAVPRSSQ